MVLFLQFLRKMASNPSILLKMEVLGGDKLRHISGGQKFFLTIFFTTVFVE